MQNIAGIVCVGMVKQVSGAPDQGGAPVAVIVGSLWWLLKILDSRAPRFHWALAPAAGAGPTCTCCWCQPQLLHAVTGCRQGCQCMGAAVAGEGLLADRGPGAAAGGTRQGCGGSAKTCPCARHSLAAQSSFQDARICALGP
uniref:Uncharacterized protein n=1 Tax=Myotis myotis TaxID=51298 RepID=A0A7J7XHX7_MYOMY|nr:hypothetical protein mMyoMyo1_011674 [Myotis myotis]